MTRNPSKRKSEFVDLVSDEDEDWTSAPRKHANHGLPTPPTSSQAGSSQRSQSRTQLTSSQRRSSESACDIWADTQTPFDADEEITTSQDFDDNAYERLQLYGTLPTKIVGVRYYNGRATLGEFVLIRREPGNQYDSNAIRCDNMEGRQIGHIPRNTAAKLARLLDSRALVVEGKLTGHKGGFDVPMDLKLYGTSDPAGQQALKEQLKNLKLPINELVQAEKARKAEEKERERRQKELERRKQAERKRLLKEAASRAGGGRKDGSAQDNEGNSSGFANLTVASDDPSQSEDPSMEDILSSSASFNPRELSEVADKYGLSEDQLAALPAAEQPAAVATKLLPYQLQGLAWMLNQESPELPKQGSKDFVQLWQWTSSGYKNIATSYTMAVPKLMSGGLLCDDMGLGKTLQVIALLLADPRRTRQPTLLISPLSVMSNWSGQISVHIKPEHALRVLTYHGTTRADQHPVDFEEFDVVITNYETMAQEYTKSGNKDRPLPVPRKTGLFSVEWRRVVLDEAHQIRNPKTGKGRAAHALLAQSRWALTGTPIINNLRDLYSLVKFLRLTGGLEQQDVFSSVLIRPLSQGHADAVLLLNTLMATICLRRAKDMKFIDLRLPSLSSHKYSVAFLPGEREKYNAFQAEAQGLLLQYQTRKNAKGENSYSHLLEVLLRLRQTCNHWKLCGQRVTDLLALLKQNKKVTLDPENVERLQALLQLSIDSQEDCAICFETLHNPRITACAHVFGGECIDRVIETQKKCPMCRSELLDSKDLVEPAIELGNPTKTENPMDTEVTSSKVEALLNILKASRKREGTKTVVFSQWTSFLDIIQYQLTANGFQFCRLDGSMNPQRRDEAMARLESDPSCTIMLASLSVCSVGLNLVAANQVILADSWWAPAIEDQAVDRVHRLGQKRDVTVFRLVMEDSIEEKVLDIQQEKRLLMMQAFGEKKMKRGNEQSTRLADIEKLLSSSTSNSVHKI